MDVYTYEVAKQAFGSELAHYISEQANFKAGDISHGIFALSRLKSMYHLLYYGRHKEIAPEESEQFLNSIDTLAKKLVIYHKKFSSSTPNLYNDRYRALIMEFDRVAQKFFEIQQLIEKERG